MGAERNSRSAVRRVGAVVLLVGFAAGCAHFAAENPSSQGGSKTTRGKVRISWTAESSQNLYGFNIYRGTSPDGPWKRVNPRPILAAEGGTTNIPHDYVYIDTDPSIVVGRPYWYWLEAVENDGNKRRVWWPPAKVVPKVRFDQQFPPLPKRK